MRVSPSPAGPGRPRSRRGALALLLLLALLPLAAPAGNAAPAVNAAAVAVPAAPPAEPDDLVFAGGRVADGTGAPLFRADVAARGGRITFVGRISRERLGAARRVVDATALVVSPGFIDLLGQSEYYALVDGRALSKVTQGITTEVTGEGASTAPTDDRQVAEGEDTWKRYGLRPSWRTLAGYFDFFRAHAPTINLGTFVGLGGLRDLVAGSDNRRLTPPQLARMTSEVEKGMREGALGVSSSLQYVPDIYFTPEELVPLVAAAGRLGGKWFVHQRSEGDRVDASLDEVFRIAREAEVSADIWHLKAANRQNWGRMPAILARIEAARAAGLDVAASAYPWTAASNGVDACLPPWIREGGREKLLERLKDPTLRERAKRDMADGKAGWENQWYGAGGAPGVMLSAVLNPALKPLEGKTFEEIGSLQKKDPRDALIDVVLADRANSSGIHFVMSEEDVRAALRHPLVAFCTDSGAVATDGILSEERSHPRAWGSAARILGKYVRDERLLPLEEAIRKMTSLPAARAGIPDRGLVKVGMAADLVAFDPATVRERSTYADPIHPCEGIPYVAVNGQLVVDGGKVTSARPGRPVLRPVSR